MALKLNLGIGLMETLLKLEWQIFLKYVFMPSEVQIVVRMLFGDVT